MIGDGKEWEKFVNGADAVADNDAPISIYNGFCIEIDGVFRSKA